VALDSLGEFYSQVEISPDALGVRTLEAHHRLGVLDIDQKLEGMGVVGSSGIMVADIHLQGLQPRKLLGKRVRFLDPSALPLLVFCPSA
jgi:hypothetical protein